MLYYVIHTGLLVLVLVHVCILVITNCTETMNNEGTAEVVPTTTVLYNSTADMGGGSNGSTAGPRSQSGGDKHASELLIRRSIVLLGCIYVCILY